MKSAAEYQEFAAACKKRGFSEWYAPRLWGMLDDDQQQEWLDSEDRPLPGVLRAYFICAVADAALAVKMYGE